MSKIKAHRQNLARMVELGLARDIPETDEQKAMETRRIGLRNAPLRAVVDRDVWLDFDRNDEGVMLRRLWWKLECGHLVSPPQDMFGARFPDKMRCGECAKKLQAGDSRK